jgi:biopolymer transport protein ExbD
MIGRGLRASRFESTHIDMVPMVDCIMVLLIFLMISTAFVNDPGIEVQKPDVGGSQLNEQNSLLIAISADNRIFFDGQQISDRPGRRLVKQAAIGRSPALIIRADRPATTGCSPRSMPRPSGPASSMCSSPPPGRAGPEMSNKAMTEAWLLSSAPDETGDLGLNLLSLLLGTGFTVGLLLGIAHFEHAAPPRPPADLDDLRIAVLPVQPPPAPVAPTETATEFTPIAGFVLAPSDSSVKIAVSPPELATILPADLSRVPPPNAQFDLRLTDFKPKMSVLEESQHVYQRSEVDRPPAVAGPAQPPGPEPGARQCVGPARHAPGGHRHHRCGRQCPRDEDLGQREVRRPDGRGHPGVGFSPAMKGGAEGPLPDRAGHHRAVVGRRNPFTSDAMKLRRLRPVSPCVSRLPAGPGARRRPGAEARSQADHQ